MIFSPRRYARKVKRLVRLLTGNDVIYRYDIRPKKETLGTVYGGWTIAPEYVTPGGIVYSFGVGTDISFDETAIKRYGFEVHGFDPSPPVIEWVSHQKVPEKYIFHPYGLGPEDGVVSFFSPEKSGGMYSRHGEHKHVSGVEEHLPIRKLDTISRELRTTSIEMLKIDIEGAEYDLIPALIESPVLIKQLLLEFHHRIGIQSLQATVDAVNKLRQNGFALFHVSDTSSEFSFLNRKLLL